MLPLQGAAIIFITHKLREAIAVCDTITVLRGPGRRHHHAGGDRPGRAGQHDGRRSVVLQVEKGAAHPGDVVLDVGGSRPTTIGATPLSTGSTCRCGR